MYQLVRRWFLRWFGPQEVIFPAGEVTFSGGPIIVRGRVVLRFDTNKVT